MKFNEIEMVPGANISGSPTSYKNKIINGNFDIWQRGASFSYSGTQYKYSADRFFGYTIDTSSAATITRQSFTFGQSDVPGNPLYYFRMDVTANGAATNAGAFFEHRIEHVSTFAGETCTISFYAKADSTKDIAINFCQVFGTGGSSEVTDAGIEKISLTSSWAKYSATINIPSVSGKTLGTDDYFRLIIWVSAGTSWDVRTNSLGTQTGTFDFARIQLEKGAIATEFEERSSGFELALCERYFQKITIPSYGCEPFRGSGSGTDMNGPFKPFRSVMRIVPTSSNISNETWNYILMTDGTTSVTGASGGMIPECTVYGYILNEQVSCTNGAFYTGLCTSACNIWFDAEL